MSTNYQNLDTAALEALENYNRVHGARIMNEALLDMSQRTGFYPEDFKDEMVHYGNSTTEMIQGYQKGRHPKGKMSLTPRVQRHNAWKMDLVMEPRKYSGRHYMARFARSGSDPYDMPLYLEWVLQNVYGRIVHDQVLYMDWQGVKQSVIAGYPNAAQDVGNGILEKQQQDIVSGTLTPISTPVITRANALDVIESFLDAIMEDSTYEAMNLDVFLSPTILRWIRYAYRETYGTYLHAQEFGITVLESHPNARLRSQAGLARSQRITATVEENLVVGYDGAVSIKEQEIDRELSILVDGEWSVDYRDAQHMFLNDKI